MSRWKRQSLATAKSVSEEELEYVRSVKLTRQLLGGASDEHRKKKKYFCCTDLIMKFTCCGNNRSRVSLLRTSDILYSLLCSTYTNYSSNKEKLAITTEILKEVTKEHDILEQAINDKHELLHNYKTQQKRMKNEKIWFKSKIEEYKAQRNILLAKEVKLHEKIDCLHDECKGGKCQLEHLVEELDICQQHLAEQIMTSTAVEKNAEKLDEDELKALLTDITDSDVNLAKKEREEESEKNAQENRDVNEKQPEKPETEQEKEKEVAELPKTQKCKKRGDRKGKNINQNHIQSLICEDLLTLQGGSDEEPLFPSFEADAKKKKSKKSCSKVTVTSESTVSLFIPNCPCKKNPPPITTFKE